MSSKLFVLASVVACVFCVPNKPLWPLEFDAPFGVNVPAIPEVNPTPIVNGSSHFYFEYKSMQASLITYLDGCLPGIYTNSQLDPCNITFLPEGIFFTSTTVATCMWFPGVGPVPPNFLMGFNYSGYDQVNLDQYTVAHFTHFWAGAGGFQYWTESSTGLDIAFTDGGAVLWNYGTLNAEPQDLSLFDVPKTYSDCSFDSGLLKKSPVRITDPLMSLSLMLAGV